MIKDNEEFEVEGFLFWKADNILYSNLKMNGDNYGLSMQYSVDWAIKQLDDRVNILDSIYESCKFTVPLKLAITFLVKQQRLTIEYQEARQKITSIEGVSNNLRDKILKRNEGK